MWVPQAYDGKAGKEIFTESLTFGLSLKNEVGVHPVDVRGQIRRALTALSTNWILFFGHNGELWEEQKDAIKVTGTMC